MPATSAASIRRKAAGILDPPKDPRKQVGARAKHAKQQGKSLERVMTGYMHSGVKGGKAVAEKALAEADVLRAKINARQNVNRQAAVDMACGIAVDAVAYLGRLVRGQEADATHRDRITASRVVLDVARVTGQVSTNQQDDSELHEMPRSALMALLGDLQAQAQQVVIEGEVVPVDPVSTP